MLTRKLYSMKYLEYLIWVFGILAGLIMLFVVGGGRYRRYKNRKDGIKRATRLIHIESLNKRVKKLERALEEEEKRLGKSIDKLKKPHGTSLYERFMTG